MSVSSTAFYVSAMITLAFVASLGNGIVFAYHCMSDNCAESEQDQVKVKPNNGVIGQEPGVVLVEDVTDQRVKAGAWFFRFKGQSGPVILNNVFLWTHFATFIVFNVWMMAKLLAVTDHHEEI